MVSSAPEKAAKSRSSSGSRLSSFSSTAMLLGNTAANLDLAAAAKCHLDSGAALTAICCRGLENARLNYIDRGDGFSEHMALAVCDTDVSASLSPEYLERCIGALNTADAVVLDGNLTAEAIRYAAEHCAAPLYADPVSVTKAGRLKPVLSHLTAFKPNEIEAAALTGRQDPADAAKALVDAGVGRVFVSLGAGGVIAADARELLRVPCEPAEIVNTTGAGDAATAAVIWAGMRGLSLEASARAAMVKVLGEKNGTRSREGVISSSMAVKMSLMRRSGVVRFTYSARI